MQRFNYSFSTQLALALFVAAALIAPTITSLFVNQDPDSTADAAIPGDLNNDGLVNVFDLGIFAGLYEQPANLSPAHALADLNNDGFIDIKDLGILASLLGTQATSTPTPTQPGTNTPIPSPTQLPNATPTEGDSGPTPTPFPTATGEFPCGRFGEEAPGCRAVSYQAWWDDVPADSRTMSVDYTPVLNHIHWELNVPMARENGQYLRQAMAMPARFVRYNNNIAYIPSHSGFWRSQDQGHTYEDFDFDLSPCQSNKYEGKECISEHVHTVTDSHMNSNTEMRFTPNVKFGGSERHYLSSNWQTGIGYRGSSELTARYKHDICGSYQRVILAEGDRHFQGNEFIPTVSGTIHIPFKTNGGCGDQIKSFIFLDPAQHKTTFGTQTGTTLLEHPGHYDRDFAWDTTQTTNGVHSLLFINLEGTDEYVSAAGVSILFNVQN